MKQVITKKKVLISISICVLLCCVVWLILLTQEKGFIADTSWKPPFSFYVGEHHKYNIRQDVEHPPVIGEVYNSGKPILTSQEAYDYAMSTWEDYNNRVNYDKDFVLVHMEYYRQDNIWVFLYEPSFPRKHDPLYIAIDGKDSSFMDSWLGHAEP